MHALRAAARDSRSRCNNLCVRRHQNTFPYQQIASQPNSNKLVSIVCTGERGQRAMRTLHPAANNCLSMPFGPQWKQLLLPNNPANACEILCHFFVLSGSFMHFVWKEGKIYLFNQKALNVKSGREISIHEDLRSRRRFILSFKLGTFDRYLKSEHCDTEILKCFVNMNLIIYKIFNWTNLNRLSF